MVVDYAHTDDALKNLTRLARDFAQRSHGRVITVFGCGGDRDRTKRPKMARAAGAGSDFVVVTSDNPRSEDPWQSSRNPWKVWAKRAGEQDADCRSPIAESHCACLGRGAAG